MGRSKIAFGDKLFLYGQLLQYVDGASQYEYNSVLGYMTVGGYFVRPVKTDIESASLPGFVVDLPVDPQFTVATPFNQMEMVDVSELLSLDLPLPSSTKVWMPTTSLPSADLELLQT